MEIEDVNKLELRARLTEVIAQRIEWGGDNEFDLEGAYAGVGYAYEGDNSTVFADEGHISIEIPLSILGTEEIDSRAYVNVVVALSDLEESFE